MEQNPYAPSQVSPVIHTSSQGDVVITPAALTAILGTQFWVKCVGIMMFVTMIYEIVDLFAESNASKSSLSGPGIGGGGEGLLMILSIVMIVFYLILAIRLMQYGKAISVLANSREALDFETAMDIQTKFWKLFGILTIIMIVLMIFFIFTISLAR